MTARRFRNRGYTPNYPRTVAEILDPQRKYHPDALRALKEFRRSKPWRGTGRERLAKFRQLNRKLAQVYGIRAPRLILVGNARRSAPMANGSYTPATHEIRLIGKLSVVTYLHEFAHARGADERQAVAWSVNLFARLFPRSFARLDQHGHTLVIQRGRRRAGQRPGDSELNRQLQSLLNRVRRMAHRGT